MQRGNERKPCPVNTLRRTAALEAAGKTFTLFQPPGTVHGFNNDTTPRYDETAAKEAWSRTLELFHRKLRA